MHHFTRGLLAAIVLLASGCVHEARLAANDAGTVAAIERRPLRPTLGDRWIGNGICYSPYRAGQRPGGEQPSPAEVREDLELIATRWNLIRTYGSREGSETILQEIRSNDLPVRVVLGVWIEPEARRDEPGNPAGRSAAAAEANAAELRTALRLAAAYPEVVVAIAVGNDTQVSWSAHRSDLATLLHYVREARRESPLPVTTADDYQYWILPESRRLSAEVDFLMAHIQPLSNGQSLDKALAWTKRIHADITATHPGVPIIIGESGWSTRKRSDGEQARRILGVPGEAEQKLFFDAYSQWIDDAEITSFWFEAFDEAWKGSDHPDDVEKHWGLFRADRSPKAALAKPDPTTRKIDPAGNAENTGDSR
jgi:exo-beta-1,3-glucanase (GH17 family)